MYIRTINIRNLRCFESAKLDFQYPGREHGKTLRLPNINLLLGNNGAGKTTVLKAIALAALAPAIAHSGFLPYRLIRRTGAEAESKVGVEINAHVLLYAQDLFRKQLDIPVPHKMSVSISRNGDYEMLISNSLPHYLSSIPSWDLMYDDKSPAFLVVGYGASRRVEDSEKIDLNARRKSRLLRYERVAGLFESHISLIPLTVWLPSFQKENPGRYKQVINLINWLLPEHASFAGELEQGEYLFEVNSGKSPFGTLSDGYRAYIGWIADLLYHVCMGAPKGAKLVDNYGIVLVDEIDLHLHPEWQRSVIATISKALPNLQFVFTSHSPIVAGSVEKENIFVMETGSDGASIARQYNESVYGLNSERVLLSSYFNLKTTRADSFVDEMKQLSVKAGEGDLKAALAFMEKISDPAQVPATVAATNGHQRKKTEKASASKTSKGKKTAGKTVKKK